MQKTINLKEKLAEKTFQINSKINHKSFYFNIRINTSTHSPIHASISMPEVFFNFKRGEKIR